MTEVTPVAIARLAEAIGFHLPHGWSDDMGRRCLDAAPERIRAMVASQSELCDMFAAHALTGLLAGESPEVGMFQTDDEKTGTQKVAEAAYAHADAMLKARGAK